MANNAGHGHVTPRSDGIRMRCGGPAMCKVCQAEQGKLFAATLADEAIDQMIAKSMTDHPQEHNSLDDYISKVEASSEDKKHEPTAADIDAQDWTDMDGATAFQLITRHADNWSHSARLMHAWRDAYAAEAVKQERERWTATADLEIATHFHIRNNHEAESNFGAAAVAEGRRSALISLLARMKDQP